MNSLAFLKINNNDFIYLATFCTDSYFNVALSSIPSLSAMFVKVLDSAAMIGVSIFYVDIRLNNKINKNSILKVYIKYLPKCKVRNFAVFKLFFNFTTELIVPSSLDGRNVN